MRYVSRAVAVGVLALQALQAPVRAGSIEIAGRTLQCANVSVGFDDGLSIEGAYFPGRGLVFNRRLLTRHPDAVVIFIFKHECAHKSGAGESGADCAAARAGRQQGWLTAAGVDEVCKALAREKEGGSHPSGAARCTNIRRCFKG